MNDQEAMEQRTYQEGALVFVSIGKKTWRTVQTPQMYGLAAWPALTKPGQVLLLPEKALKPIDHIEDRARGVSDAFKFNYGIEDEGRTNMRWIHISKLGLVLTALDELKEQFFQAVDDLISNYEALKLEVKAAVAEDYKKRKESMNNPDLKDPWPDIESQYPAVGAIKAKYYFLVRPYNMTFPTGISAVKNYEVTQADLALMNRKKMEEVTAEDMARMQASHRERLDRVLREQQAEAVRRTDAFVESVVQQLRGKVVETFESIANKIQGGGKVIGPNLDAIRETLLEVRQMDFIGSDTALHERLNQIEQLINSGKSFKDDSSAAAELNRALNDTVTFISSTNQAAVDSARKTYFGRRLNI